ncbi:MAG TPA: threonine synthase [Steroidobacteraceae bacterium]|nr:threonine synthase [Steroidobacteraceae bacterium]
MNAMRFVSTRNPESVTGFVAALERGLAPDGGLYVPSEWPVLMPRLLQAEAASQRAGADPARPARLSATALASLASSVIAPFAAGSALASDLPAVAAEAFSFAAPLTPLDPLEPDGAASLLELFHGPTAAFKDFGARFLAASLAHLRRARRTAPGSHGSRTLTIVVATSGDTGGAVASAFHERPGIEVVVLYPKGLVSPTQERQLTCWGGNVRSFAVRGTFDDCQRLAKEALLDPQLRERSDLSSANSINLGRLLPQVVYYAAASLAVRERHGAPASFVIPSGNLGNALACIWARKLGLPIAAIVLAHNANRTVPDFLATGDWRPRPSVATLASAMDVGNPSNMERLRALYPDLAELRGAVRAETVDDAQIRAAIQAAFRRFGRILCPHTATALEVYERLPREQRNGRPWVLVATAHAAKFRETIEPLIGQRIPVPDSLAQLLARPVSVTEIAPQLATLRSALWTC